MHQPSQLPRGTDPAFRLDGRTAIVVGASSAIGDAIALSLAGAGARLVLADRADEGMRATRDRLQAAGCDAICQIADVTQRGDIEALAEAALARTGRLDVMVNLAGVIHDARVVDTQEADLDRVLAVNLKGVYFGCQAAVRSMLRGQRGGSIVNMASSAAFTALPTLSAYSISKAGVVALTRVLASEVGGSGIRVNAVAPGYVEGGMAARHVRRPDGTIDEVQLEAVHQRVRRHNPLRATGEPLDVAHAVLYLASDASRYLTGQVLHPNGGAYMP